MWPSFVLEKPCPLRHRLRSPSRGFAPLSCSQVFPSFWLAMGKTVTSSNCELAAQSDIGSPQALRSCEQHGPRPPSKGPTLLLRSAARFWRAPSPGERCAWAPLLRKPRAPSVVDLGVTKAWRALLTFSTSTGDLRSLAAPRRETLSRKSGCLGRAVSLSPRRRNLLRRPTGPLLTPPFRALPGECRAFFCLLLCLALTHQAEDKWLAHARPTGCPWGVT